MDQPNKEEKTEEEHTFKFRFNSEIEPSLVVFKTSMTVLEALNENESFRKKNESPQQEIVIQRPDGTAVNTDFPCCLIGKDEILTLTFIKSEKEDFTAQQTHKALSHHRTDLVTFNIKTTGGENVMHIMKNTKLRKTVDYVCVWALKREEVKTALERDGRFVDNILNEKHCELIESNEIGKQTKNQMSNPAEYLDKRTFKIIAVKLKKQTDVKNESDVASNTSDSARNDPDQNPISTEQKQTLHNKEYTSLLTNWSVIPDSKEILQILHDQHKDLLKTLKEREKLKDNSQVRKFFRAEYDKSVQSFSEVKKVKQLMRLSDSVCQIRVEGSAKGTGFLLFDRFVLTNAHVIGEFDPFTRKLSKTFTAVFGYEDLEAKETKCVLVKEHVAAYHHGKIMDRHLDFALLELNADNKIADYPQMLSCYSPRPPPNRGGICIVGHPDGGIKRMDPCFIIENLQEAAGEHISKNVEFIQVMTQQSFEEKWDIYKNQITYDSCLFHGSSGSPVFDEDCYLIGVHTGGYVYKGKNSKNRSIMEYAYSMQPILDVIRAQAKASERSDILKLLSEKKSLNLNLEDNVVDTKKQEIIMDRVMGE